jgi:hypothetical protein
VNRDELESQLSAMYDGELPAAECELLSRRLVREEPLRASWSRYAVMGAALRAEPVARVRSDFALRVRAQLDAGAPQASRRRLRRSLGQWAVGAGVAASVAGVAILLLRQDLLSGQGGASSATPVVATRAPAASPGLGQSIGTGTGSGGAAAMPALAALGPRASGEPASYVVPPAGSATGLAVPASLADYVVAHSEVSSPLVRRSLLSALVATESLEPAVLPAQAGPVAAPAGPVAPANERGDARANGVR